MKSEQIGVHQSHHHKNTTLYHLRVIQNSHTFDLEVLCKCCLRKLHCGSRDNDNCDVYFVRLLYHAHL